MKKYALEFVNKCEQCQKYAPIIQQAGKHLNFVTSPWPFKWGMDIVGPLPPGRSNVKFFLVLNDYLSIWVEAGAFSQLHEQEVIVFIWRNIIC